MAKGSLEETIHTGQPYALEVEVSGDTATLRVDGQTKVSHTFASGIQGGQVGLRVENAHTHVQEVALRQFVNVTRMPPRLNLASSRGMARADRTYGNRRSSW